MKLKVLWKIILSIDWSRVLRPLPTLAFVVGISITIWVSHIVREREQESVNRQISQRATDVVDRTVLLVFNSILRIQSYDELFDLTGSRVKSQIPTLQRALRRTIFKRLSVFQLLKNKDSVDHLPVLKKMQIIEAGPNSLPQNTNTLMVSEYLRVAVGQLLKTGFTHQIVVQERQGVLILSVVWRAGSNRNAFYLFSSPVVEFFAPEDLNPGEKLVITDPLSTLQWEIETSEAKVITKARVSDGQSPYPMNSAMATLDPSELNSKLDLQFVGGSPQSVISLYQMALLIGLLTTFFTTYLFWILLSQNRRISKLVVDKTYDLENANSDLHEALAARSRFLANVSHEIRTPLNLILGMIELCEESASDEKQRNYLKSMNTAGNHLLGMVEDILDLSRPEFHSVDIKFISIGLIQFLEEIGRIVAPICMEKNLKFHLVLSPDLPQRLQTDPSRLRQILINLLRNSTKYTREGFILLKVSRLNVGGGQETLRFEVEDSGVGIPKDRINRVFDAFFQIQGSKILSSGGVGLGLSIVKDLVRKLNGRIEVASVEGVGSIFRIDMVFESLDSGCWVDSYEASEGEKNIYVVSLNPHFMDDLVFLKGFRGVEITLIEKLELSVAMANLLKAPGSSVIIDASVPPTKEGQQFLSQLGLERLIFVGDRRISIRPEGSSKIVKIEANPIFPTQVLSSLGYSPRVRRTKDEELAPLSPLIEASDMSSAPSIVVADDDPGNRELFGAYLESFSSKVRFAEDGQQALEMCRLSRPDFLIADLRMPILDGFGLIEKIREDEKVNNLKPMKILLITADALEETAELAKATSADIYLTKPIRKATLLDAFVKLGS